MKQFTLANLAEAGQSRRTRKKKIDNHMIADAYGKYQKMILNNVSTKFPT